ncbi:uncharacterized protein LTR77_002699 [Saxophila tyrrhenica]|uniref:AA9 family lytic polysaccharide monooxygenase n=1 Tax=Saxophila tyrrhenica TaxID=1690608 RepID=A0AAV9PI47_9PEZI|nr:hypothetical protein LTR77_002699 [Saxophila tyrrhenica]
MSALQILGLVAGIASTVSAHGYVSGIVVGGKYYQGYDPSFSYMSPPPKVIGWTTTVTDNGFVAPSAYKTSDIICHRGGAPGQASATIAAGGKVELQWTEWPESHHGPVIDYMAKCPGKCEDADPSSLEFFKVSEGGLINGNPAPGKWASDDLIANNNTWETTIPSTLAPGNYVLRNEIIALHSAGQADGAQNYPQCINLQVTGSGSDKPAGEPATQFYTPTDPGIKVDIYGGLSKYVIPGPALYGKGGSSSPAPSSAPAAPSSSAPVYSSAAAAPSSTEKPVSNDSLSYIAPSSSAAAVSSSAPVYSVPASSSAGAISSSAPYASSSAVASSSKCTTRITISSSAAASSSAGAASGSAAYPAASSSGSAYPLPSSISAPVSSGYPAPTGMPSGGFSSMYPTASSGFSSVYPSASGSYSVPAPSSSAPAGYPSPPAGGDYDMDSLLAQVIKAVKVQQHRSSESCWVILYGNVYDVTSFLPDHPGGSKIILQLAGSDATEEYDPVHPPGTLEDSLPPEAKLGPIDASTLPKEEKAPEQDGGKSPKREQRQQEQDEDAIDSLEECLNLDDIEKLATQRISRKAWGYYYSAGDDLMSKRLNNRVYSSILMRPRIFVDCTNCDTSTALLGNKVNLPFFVSPAAMARLGHPDGEHGIARACAKFGAMQLISHNASQTPEQIVADAQPSQVFGWQLYVQSERKKSEAMLARINKLKSIKFICLTLDAPVPGKREHDERSKNVGSNLGVRSSVQEGSASKTSEDPASASGGVGKALFAGTAPDLTWKTTLPWLRKHTDLPIVLKGVQTHEDAYIASLYAPLVSGIILSNHGGRAMDTAPPAIHTLLEIRKYCPSVFKHLEVWVDGGIKRGTDIVKALCLGAKGVGIGRAPLFGLGAGGKEGVERVLEILKAETETAMRLLGVERVEELGPRCVNARAVERDLFDGVESPGRERWGMWVRSML